MNDWSEPAGITFVYTLHLKWMRLPSLHMSVCMVSPGRTGFTNLVCGHTATTINTHQHHIHTTPPSTHTDNSSWIYTMCRCEASVMWKLLTVLPLPCYTENQIRGARRKWKDQHSKHPPHDIQWHVPFCEVQKLYKEGVLSPALLPKKESEKPKMLHNTTYFSAFQNALCTHLHLACVATPRV